MIRKIKKIFRKSEQKGDTIKLIGNINWLLLDRIVRMVGGVFVNAAVSRYLGPESMGKWDTALAYAGIFIVLSALGGERIIIRDLVSADNEQKQKILGTGISIRFISSFILSWICAYLIYFFNSDDIEQTIVGVIVSGGVFLQSFDVIIYLFQAKLLSKRIVQTKTIAFIVSSIMKVVLIFLQADLYAFVATFFLEMLISAILLVWVYSRYEGVISQWKFSRKIAKTYFKEGIPMLISGLAYMIYVRADQLMISEMLTKSDVGVYSRAIKLYEIPMAIYTVFATTLFPKLTSLYSQSKTKFWEGYQLASTLMTFIALVGVFFTWLIGQYVVIALYGEAYEGAIEVLNVLMVGVVFLYNAGQRGNYLILSGKYNIIIISAFLSSCLNIVMNYIFISRYGIIGAAWASVITQFFVMEVSNIFFKETRKLFKLQLKSLFLINLYHYYQQVKKQF